MAGPYNIQIPVSGQPISSSQFGARVKAGVDDLDARATALEDKPIVRLTQAVVQSIPNGADTAITFTTEDMDSHGYHDTATNNTRVTPTKAGIYTVEATFAVAGRADYTTVGVAVYKNGSPQAPRNRTGPNTSNAIRTVNTSALVSMNGTTDYVEVWGIQSNAAAVAVNTSAGSSFASVLEMKFERDPIV